MINTKNRPNSPLRILFIGLFLILSLTSVHSSIDYCITNKPYDVVPLVGNQTVALTLGDYVRGYNLTFETDQPIAARPFNPLNAVAQTPYGFKPDSGYKIINADVLESTDKKWHQNGVVLAQKDSKNIALVVTEFTGTRNIDSKKLQPLFYTLTQQVTCFSANVVSRDGGVVIDCQTNDEDEPQDYLCYIDTSDDKSPPNCIYLDALQKTTDRKTEVLLTRGQVYLLSAPYSRDKTTQSMTYLTIYHVEPSKKMVSFSNIIDSAQLGLDYQIVISDFDVLRNGTIVIHDVSKSQLLFVDYSLADEITLIGQPWVYGSEGAEIEVTNLGTVMIATKSYVEEWDLTIKRKVFRYELEKGDINVIGLGVNTWGVVVETDRNFLYVYQRIFGTVNYLLGSVYVGNKDYLISSYSNVVYVFDDKQYDLYELTSGWLRLNNFEQSTNVTVTAHSSTSSCKFTVQIIKLENSDKIVEKQSLSQKKFTTENSQAISLNLEDIYSGQYLTYEVPQSTDQIKFKLEHLSAYEVTTGLKDASLTQIVNVNDSAYILLGLATDKVNAQMCISDDSTQKITCTNIYTSTLFKPNPILLTGRRRSSGQVVFVWTYAENQFEYLAYSNGKFAKSYTVDGSQFEYSSVVIGEDRIYFVYKMFARIQMWMDLSPSYNFVNIDSSNFEPINDQMTGFYPRQLYLHPRNNEMFYVKFPMSVCLMTLINGKTPKLVDCNKVLEKMIPDLSWDVVIGTYTYVVFSPEGIKEYMILGNEGSLLHSINIPFTLPVYYSQFLNTVIFRSALDGKAIYYKLNKPLSDCLYYSTPLKDSLGDSSEFFSSEGAWTISTQNWKAYRQSYNTKLSIQIIGDNKSFKQDIHFSIKVKGAGNDTINTDNNITVVHYPTNITKNSTVNDVLTLPEVAVRQMLQIDPEKYLKGPKAAYSIVCDYCGSNITLEGAFKNKTQNKQIIGAESIIEVFDNHVIVLTNNRINLVDSKGSLVTYKIVQHIKQCQQMAWHQKVGLLVVCQDETGQEMFGFDVTTDNITQWTTTYPIHQEAIISYIDEIFISQIDDNTYWMFVEDNDITDLREKNTKKANVKVFVWTKDSLAFKGILNSESFGIVSDIVFPINDIDVVNGKVMVASIGGVGIGYAPLANQKDAPNVLVNPQVISLRSIPQIQTFLLDDTIFQQVQLVASSSSSVSILVTSSTGIAMILQFTIEQNSSLTYKQIQQSFNRYGTYPSVNWQAVNNDVLLLSFYNVDDGEEYLTLYRRSNSTMIDFAEALTVTIDTYQLGEHSVLLMKSGVLFVSDVGSEQADAKVTRYDLSAKYNLVMTYTAPGNFSNISLVATNQYASEHAQIKVTFAGHNDDQPSGLKWYTIMIITLIVVLIVGVGWGMYLKMMKNRKDKKVSLLTEGEEVDEVV